MLVALGANCRFVARSVGANQKHLQQVFTRAYEHRGASFVEVCQNCLVYNDGVFDDFVEKDVAPDAQVLVEHGKPLIFGREKNRGLRLKPGLPELEIVTIGENGISEDDILVHDETSRALAVMLAALEPPTMPVALGVLYCNPAPSFDHNVMSQIKEIQAQKPGGDLNGMLREGHIWTVSG